jgi:superfamily II DNA/RNA helicase
MASRLHSIYEVYEHQKVELLLHLVQQNEDWHRTIIFLRSREQLYTLTTELRNAGFKADSISGNKKLELREQALINLKSGTTHLLLATEAILRDADLAGTERIIQFDFHELEKDYLNRTESCSEIITLVTQNDNKLLAKLEALIPTGLERKQAPEFSYHDQPRYLKPTRAKGCGPNKTGSKPLQHKKPKLKNKGPRRKTGRTRKR